MESAGCEEISLGKVDVGAAGGCGGMLGAAAVRGSPRRLLGRGADRGSMGIVSAAPPLRLAGPGWEEGVYMISELGAADTAGRGEPLMRSGAVAGTPADANVLPCNRWRYAQ